MASNAFQNTLNTAKSILPLGRSKSYSSDDSESLNPAPITKRLPWFGTPIDDGSTGHHEHHDDGDSETQSWEEKHGVADGYPRLHKAHEAPVIQLFYDLFFVANLTTFTSVHEVNDSHTLKTYIGFFGMLWFAWLQSTLFDIRFGNDSVFERICKALQFGVMAGFAVVGPAYKAGWDIDEEQKEAAQALKAFQTLSVIMMVSRLVLVAQYTVVLVLLREWRKTIVPLLLHIVLFSISAAIFLGLFYSFLNATGDKAVIAWYVMIGIEAGVALLISAQWKFLSFRKTNVVERIGLITLIVIGEGIIGLCKSIQKVGNDQQFGADIVGMIICAVVIVYCFWMIYFDQAEHERVGTFRQLIWIMLHFPFHVAVLFTSEGVAQLSMWRKLLGFWYSLDDKLNAIAIPTTNAADTLDNYVNALKNVTDTWMTPLKDGMLHLKLQQPDFDSIYKQIEDLADSDLFKTNNTAWKEQLGSSMADLYNQAAVFAAKTFNIEEPEHLAPTVTTEAEALDLLINHTFLTVFIYFFVAAGLALIFSACLYIFGKRHKNRRDYLNIAFRCLLGFVLAMLALMAVSTNGKVNELYTKYATGPWMIPTVTIMYVFVVIVHHICTR